MIRFVVVKKGKKDKLQGRKLINGYNNHLVVCYYSGQLSSFTFKIH